MTSSPASTPITCRLAVSAVVAEMSRAAETSEPTPAPPRYVLGDDKRLHIAKLSDHLHVHEFPSERLVARCFSRGDAAIVLRACNVHDDLLAAADGAFKKLSAFLVAQAQRPPDQRTAFFDSLQAERDALCAAIAKAKEGDSVPEITEVPLSLVLGAEGLLKAAENMEVYLCGVIDANPLDGGAVDVCTELRAEIAKVRKL